MEKLQVIFANRNDCFEKSGGDTVQMMKTKEYLEKNYPVEVIICLNPDEFENYPDVKIVHIFNLQTVDETNKFIKKAKELDKKVVLSTIYWDLLDTYYVKYLKFLNIPPLMFTQIGKKIVIKIFNFFMLSNSALKSKFSAYLKKGLFAEKEYFEFRKKALLEADCLLPNSDEEMELCAKNFDIPLNIIKEKTVVVPNAIEWENFTETDLSSDTASNIELPEKYVVCAGRISSDKNQLNIVRALFNLDVAIVLVGGAYDESYNKQLKKIADKRGNVIILPHVTQTELFKIYQNAQCHILASFRESPGLVTLEALANNCKVVVSSAKFCPIKYYELDKFAKVCYPYSLISIRNAVLKAINDKTTINISDEYKQKFSYDNVANITFSAYQNLLEKRLNA